tara:strand:- start:496 stop:861 length:366 start_codon:yes stop_codon:yes gene_type:complete
MIVNAGKEEIMANYILAKYTVIKIGDGSDSTSPSQLDLDHVVYTHASDVTPTKVGSTLIWNVDFLGSQIPTSGITELGIFHNNGNTTVTDSGEMLTRVTFTSTGVVAASDTVSFTIRVELK